MRPRPSGPEAGGRSLILGILLPLGLLGCESPPAVIRPSPDYPTLGKSRPTRQAVSSLVVSTGTWTDLNLGSGDDGTVVRHTGYAIYDEQGNLMTYVRNYIGTSDPEPTILELDPGRYLIRLDKPEGQAPVFWVVVEPGNRTEVKLPK